MQARHISLNQTFLPHPGYGIRTQYSSATPLRITRKLLYFLQASPLFKNYLLATPLTEKEDVVSWLSAFSRFFLVFLLTQIARYVVCLPAASLRPPFLLHRRWSFCTAWSVHSSPYLFNERRQGICFPKSKSRFCASIPCQWVASKERILLYNIYI